MGLISDLLQTRAATPPAHVSRTDHDWETYAPTAATWAGPTVTAATALQSAAVYACVRVIADAIASLPLITYRRLADRGKARAPDHPLYALLHTTPNPELTAYEWRQLLFGHVLLWGNAYAEIDFDGAGRILGLWPLRPDRVTPRRVAGAVVYDVTMPQGGIARLPGYRVHHLRAYTVDGLAGLSPIALAAQTIGVDLAMQEYAGRFFANGAKPGMLFKHPGILSPEAHANLQASLQEQYGGLSNAHRIQILEEGMDVSVVGVPPEDAQLLESRRFSTGEIARIFRVPPHMIGDLERATFSNIEQQSLDFLQHTLRPWIVSHEQAIARDLIPADQRAGLVVEYLIDGLLRADSASRMAAYQTAITNGIMAPNEARERENWNPYPGGDTYYLPINIGPIDETGRVLAPADAQEARQAPGTALQAAIEAPGCTCAAEARQAAQRAPQAETRAQAIGNRRRALAGAFVDPLQEAAARIAKREAQDLLAQLRRQDRALGPFWEWLKEYGETLAGYSVRTLEPILRTLAATISASVAEELEAPDLGLTETLGAFVAAYTRDYAAAWSDSTMAQLRALYDAALAENRDPGPDLEQRIEEWTEKRAEKEAQQTAYNAGNAIALALYGGAGIAYLRWNARATACPFCRRMDGRRQKTGAAFVEPGEPVHGEADAAPIVLDRPKKHPPLHRACDCMLLADR